MTDNIDTLADRLEGLALSGGEWTLTLGSDEALELSDMLRDAPSRSHVAQMIAFADWRAEQERWHILHRRLMGFVLSIGLTAAFVMVLRSIM